MLFKQCSRYKARVSQGTLEYLDNMDLIVFIIMMPPVYQIIKDHLWE